MTRQENKYKYVQLERYKEQLEMKHIKLKMVVVNLVITIIIGVLLYFTFGMNIDPKLTNGVIMILSILVLLNIGFYHVETDKYNNLTLSMYMTVIGIYVATNILIFNFLTPSIFTTLFLAYAITAIYQDLKAMILSSSLLFISGFGLVSQNPQIFSSLSTESPQLAYIQSFLLIFVLLLTLSSYILIKRKMFFYNQLASIKESELRNIELMKEIELISTKKESNFKGYYSAMKVFNKELSKKIGVEDLLGRKIQILESLQTKSPVELLQKYNDLSVEDLERLQNLEIITSKKMRYLAEKASKTYEVNTTKKDIFSESQFKSFKHPEDSKYTQIISFVVFYTLLKVDKPYLNKIDEITIKDMLYNSEFYYRVDKDIMDIYLKNSEVFDTIVNDYLKGGW